MLKIAILVCLSGLAAWGQTTTAQITGKVTDVSGAAVTGARVSVTNAGNGAVRGAESNELGNYILPLLEPAVYNLRVEKEGFTAVAQNGLTLHVDQAARMDFQLQVGTVKETVSVTADAPLLQESEAALGTVIENRNILEMPLNGRNPFDLVFLAPGAVQYEKLDLAGNNIAASNMSVNGAPSMSSEVLLDGVPNTSPQHGQYALVPSIDSVQEFKVQTNNMSAEFGRTAGGVINVTMKAGTNDLHGVLYEFLRNRVFDANTWLNKRTGTDRPKFVYNQAGFNVGGPIRKNKLFFFGNYEALRRRLGRPFLFSIPSLEMRQGNFSDVANQRGTPVLIYDPTTTRPQSAGSATNVRDLFPNNRIPLSRFDKVSANLLKYYPEPNLPGERYTYQNNFISSLSEHYNVDQIHGRIDYNVTSKFQMFGRISWNSSEIVPPNVFGNIGNPASGLQIFTQRNAGLSGTYSVRANTFASFRFGYLRYRDHSEPLGMGFDLTQLGFPAYVRDVLPAMTPPSINITGYQVTGIGFGTSSIGPPNGGLLNNITNTYSGYADLTHIRGAHVIKTGYDARVFRIAGFRPLLPTFNFNKAMTQGPNPNNTADTAGNAMASFLLGTGNGGNIQLRANQDVQSWYMGTFLQDDYKIRRNLTLNLGARFEYESPRTDRYNRLNWLNLNAPSGLTVPGVGTLRGGLQFVGVNGNSRGQMDLAPFFSPRFGFAWQAQKRMAVRGGYGIFLAPRYGGEFNGFGQIGFQATTTYVASINSITPNAFLSNPFPNGFVQPTGSSQGLLTNIGADATSWERNSRSPYVQQWNLNIQRSVWANLVAEIAYAGSKGTHLPQSIEFNQLPDQYLSMGSELQRTVANPFYGIIPEAQAVGKATTTVAQLLRPYPQFTSVQSTYATAGSSIYHSMQVRLQKRFSRGATFLLSYTNGKLIDDGSPGRLAFFGNVPNFQNSNNRRLERAVSSQEVSQRLTASYTVMLPFGRGQRLLTGGKGVLGGVFGGWQLNGIHAFQTGRPITITNAVNNAGAFNSVQRPNSTGVSAALSGSSRDRIDRYFDTAQFTAPTQFTYGNVGRSLPDVRTPGLVTTDLSMAKNVRIRERFRLQFRFEAFNAINWTNLMRPASVFGNADFGTIRSAQDMRILQLGMKLYF